MVDVFVCALNACQVLRDVWKKLVDSKCGPSRQMARSWKLVGKIGFIELLSYSKSFLGVKGLKETNLLDPRDSQDCFLIAEHIHLETVE